MNANKRAEPRQSGNPGRGVRVPGQKLDIKTVKRVLSYLGAYKLRLAAVFVCIIISALAGVYGASFLKTLIDDYVKPLMVQENPDLSGLKWEIIKLGIIYACGALASFGMNRLMVTVAQSVLKNIRQTMFARMQRLPVKYFDTHNFGDTMSRYTNDTDTLRQLISQSIPQVVSSLCTVAATFSAMLVASVWLTLFVVVTAFAMMLLVKALGGKSGKYFVKQQQSVGKVNGYIEEMINGQKVIQVFTREAETVDGFDELNGELCGNSAKANVFANVLGPVMNNLGHLQYILIAVLGGVLAIYFPATGLTLGGIMAFLQLSRSFTNPVNQVSQQINAVVMSMAGAKRIFELMDEEPETDEGYVTLVNARRGENGEITECDEHTGLWAWKHPHGDGTLTYTELKGDVRMSEVDFGYVPEKIVLHDVTLFAEPGQKVAFVGATGAGKTTITNLINRFYDIADGKIRYDGININKIKKADLRRSLGMVLQDVHLFTGTVMENIRYGRLDATDEECIAAAKLANADSFISVLPEGYRTLLEGDGSGLSQGQRQLLAIARAAV
ncbi:MAG: ABC transporter ATP-binding protein, partial [Clostridia bacterium]|nr:ABC transporter ATP-binding protein [Clostridia bacterium]